MPSIDCRLNGKRRHLVSNQTDLFPDLAGIQWEREFGPGRRHGSWHLWIDGEHKGSVTHCGHPTANWPYYAQLVGSEEMILARNGRGFPLLKEAQSALLERVSG